MMEDGKEREATWLDWVASTHSKDNGNRFVDLTAHLLCLEPTDLVTAMAEA